VVGNILKTDNPTAVRVDRQIGMASELRTDVISGYIIGMVPRAKHKLVADHFDEDRKCMNGGQRKA
jgi:hypothetical protein